MNNITLKQLRAFVAVADAASFKNASRNLHLSQPALSQTIRQLETEIGNALFRRTTRSVSLAPLGQSFLPHARHLLRQFDSVIGEVQQVAHQKQGRVSIACLPSVASRLMPRVIATSDRLFPGIRVVIRDMNMRAVVESLRGGESDIAIGGSVASEDGTLESFILGHDYFHALMPITSPLARRRSLKWSDLAGKPFIAMSHDNGMRGLIDAVAAEQSLDLKIVAEVSNVATLNGMLEEGIGVSALPGLALPRNEHAFVRHRPLTDPSVRRAIRLFWRGSFGLSPAAQAIVVALRHTIEAEDPAHLPHVEWRSGIGELLGALVEGSRIR
jgi:DNA-binding transcriptional LysR family regulator